MANFLSITATWSYKGHTIERTESPIQIFFVVDKNLAEALWSLADAKRFINKTALVSQPVDIRHWI